MYKQKLNLAINLAIVLILFSALVFAIPATAYDEGSGSTTGGSFTVTVAKTGAPPAGFGHVWSSPSGLDCPGTCSAEFNSGTEVFLNASNTPKMKFLRWDGDCFGWPRTDPCVLTMNSDKNVLVRFYPPKRRLSISIMGLKPVSSDGALSYVLGEILFSRQSNVERENGSFERVSGMDATVVLTNTSTRSLDIGLIAGADPLEAPFEIFDDACSDTTLPRYQECSFNINYDPVDDVLYKDTFDIPSSDPNFPTWTVTVREADENGN